MVVLVLIVGWLVPVRLIGYLTQNDVPLPLLVALMIDGLLVLVRLFGNLVQH